MSSFPAASSFPFAGPDPSLTIATLIEAQHKNAAALGSANQATIDGLKTLVERQGFLLTASVDTYTRVTSDLLAARSFEERATKQADATRDAYVSIVARFRELSDILIETNVAAMGIVNARIIEAFGDLKALFAPPVAVAAPGEAPAAVVAEPAVAALEEVAAVEKAISPVEPVPATVTAAPTPAPEVVAEEAEVAAPTNLPETEPEVAAAPTIAPETAAPESKVAAAPTPPPRKAAPAKAAVSPSRTTAPKTPPLRPPRRPTSRG